MEIYWSVVFALTYDEDADRFFYPIRDIRQRKAAGDSRRVGVGKAGLPNFVVPLISQSSASVFTSLLRLISYSLSL
jgi:hypothetical protein